MNIACDTFAVQCTLPIDFQYQEDYENVAGCSDNVTPVRMHNGRKGGAQCLRMKWQKTP